jgi:hypothetical protein
MQYLLMIYQDDQVEAARKPEEFPPMMAAYMKLTNDVKEAGVYLGGNPLQPGATATTVRVRDGKIQTTDGPFAETKEQLGGYYLLDCKDLDEALKWAAQIPHAELCAIEVRPVMVFG